MLIFLLFLSACINYIDRGSLSVAAPLLASELALSPVQMGVLFSSFFWSYATCMILAGWLTDRYSVFWVYSIGFVLWSVATLASGFAGGMTSLIILRLLLGAGESVAFPAYSKIIAAGFPIERRGWPNSVLEAGTKIGPALGTLIGAMLMARYGWRVLFFVLGAGSLLWLIPWIIWAPRPSKSNAATPVEGPRMLDIVRRRQAWGTFIGSFGYSYAFYFLLSWLPTYLVNERHLSLKSMGVLGSLPFWGSAISAVLCGWASDAWIRRGGSPTRVRETFVVSGLLLSMAMLPSAIVSDIGSCIVLLSIAYAAFGMYASNHWAISQTLAGPGAAGKWTGIQNALNSLSGIIAPVITGFIVSGTGSYYWAFVLPAVLLVIGALSYVFLVGEVAPLEWQRHPSRTEAGPAILR